MEKEKEDILLRPVAFFFSVRCSLLVYSSTTHLSAPLSAAKVTVSLCELGRRASKWVLSQLPEQVNKAYPDRSLSSSLVVAGLRALYENAKD